MMYCRVCLDAGRKESRAALRLVMHEKRGNALRAYVCVGCLEHGVTTRVTCKTFSRASATSALVETKGPNSSMGLMES
jgi:hypothetical protein